MADPIIIVKENPGTLLIEVFDENEVSAGTLKCPSVPFRTQDSELDIGGSKFKPKPNPKHGSCVEIKITKVRS